MNDALLMNVTQGVGGGTQDHAAVLEGQASGFDQAFQAFAFDKFHADKVCCAFVAVLEDFDDVGMV